MPIKRKKKSRFIITLLKIIGAQWQISLFSVFYHWIQKLIDSYLQTYCFSLHKFFKFIFENVIGVSPNTLHFFFGKNHWKMFYTLLILYVFAEKWFMCIFINNWCNPANEYKKSEKFHFEVIVNAAQGSHVLLLPFYGR